MRGLNYDNSACQKVGRALYKMTSIFWVYCCMQNDITEMDEIMNVVGEINEQQPCILPTIKELGDI